MEPDAVTPIRPQSKSPNLTFNGGMFNPLFIGKSRRWIIFWLVLIGSRLQGESWVDGWRSANPNWRGVHVITRTPSDVLKLVGVVPQLAMNGMNVLIVEVDYNFAFTSHPELRESTVITRVETDRLTDVCHRNGVRLIPQFNCLGHQSWSTQTFSLLRVHPEFDETPGLYPRNEGIYCRSWCPQNPAVGPVVFALMDEIADAFQADAMHIGMDEVFLIASDSCPRCRGQDPGLLFAKSITEMHRHLVREKHLDLLMWADRLLDSKTMGYGEWESATNGTSSAVGKIPKDILLCDWHYETLDKYQGHPSHYASISYLTGQGFRVWPTGWKTPAAIEAFNREALAQRTNGVLGYLCSTWGAVSIGDLPAWPPLTKGFEPWK